MTIERPTFATTLMRAGYDPAQVDDAVDRIVAGELGPADIGSLRFATVSYRTGYDMEQVDDWLSDVADGQPREGLPSVEASPSSYAPEPTRSDAIVRADDRSTRVALAWGLAVVAVVLVLAAVL